MHKKKQLLASFGLGLVSAVCFVPTGAIWLMFLLFPIWFAFIDKAQTKKALFGLGFCFGAGMGAASLFWLTQALMIDDGAFAWALPVVPIGFGLVFGFFWGIPALLCYWSRPGFSRLVMLAGTLTFFEWVRSWIFTGFPWNLLGSMWIACLPIAQLAAITGVYGLTFASVFWFAAPYFYKNKHLVAGIAATFVLVFVGGYGRLAALGDETVWGIRLRLVQPNIAQTLKWDPAAREDNLMKHIRLSKKAGQKQVTHVIWPEAAVPYLLNVDTDARAMTISAVPQGGTLITGGMRLTDPKSRQLANSIFVLNDMGEIKTTYDKSHLVPFGEYVPLRGLLPFDKVVPISSDFVQGPHVRTVRVPNAPPAGMLVCYEVIFPGRVVQKKYRPKWLVNVTNDGWYGLSAGPYQHLAAAQMRAIEEGLPVVRAAGTGISAVIAPTGEITASLPLGLEGVLDADLPRDLPPTLYGRMGNLIPLLMCLLAIGWAFQRNNDQKHSSIKDAF